MPNPKIFRAFPGGANIFQDWSISPQYPYNANNRNAMPDPNGSTARHQITSIPSPFARIDLVKNAFIEVCKLDTLTGKVDLDGTTIFHKMVSDTLDVAEIFFNIDRYKGAINIITWDPAIMIPQLQRSNNPGQKCFGDTLATYLISDAKAYNFGMMKNIYLLNYTGENAPDRINIIGATSPATLFFSTASDLSYVQGIKFGNHIAFSKNFQPLYSRDPQFIQYLFALQASIPNFAATFPDIDNYLSKTFTQIGQTNPQLQSALQKISTNTLAAFQPIATPNGNNVEVLGNALYKRVNLNVAQLSQFVINSSSGNVATNPPLVLPIVAGNNSNYCNLTYTTANWGATNAAPINDSAPVQQRKLPYDGTQYPYLTISDFLEDSIIKVQHRLNSHDFFNGNLTAAPSNVSYLLPLTPLFFEYFNVNDIKGKLPDGKNMIELTQVGGANGGVKIILRVPINGSGPVSYVEYCRTYYNYNSQSQLEPNDGYVSSLDFTGFITPQIAFANPADVLYNISCIHDSDFDIKFEFYNKANKTPIKPDCTFCRDINGKLQIIKAENYLIKNMNFDFIRINDGAGHYGILVPIFRPQNKSNKFEFAVDLGTSNTHIEFKTGNTPSQSLPLAEPNGLLSEIFVQSRNSKGDVTDLQNETEFIEKDYIPKELGSEEYCFPTRTVLSYAETLGKADQVFPFTHVNLPFTYDKKTKLPFNRYRDNIKWEPGNDWYINAYVRSLMMIIRNKVLLNDGNLQSTKITWFYPISMTPKRRTKLENTWNSAYREYFGPGTTQSMTESAAPIQYFFRNVAAVKDLVNIDIGGGTTDIAFATDKTVNYVTSFRFASNSLFEDAFAPINNGNGIIDCYKTHFSSLFKNKNLDKLDKVYEEKAADRPSNWASFFFGLKNNPDLVKAQVNPDEYDFNKILEDDDDFKIVFIIFYTSIIYHIAHIVKTLKLDAPRHISLTGNGSKIINVLTSNQKILGNYTKLVFEKVLEKKYDKDLDFLGWGAMGNPKEATCKGGIFGTTNNAGSEKPIVLKSDCSGLVDDGDTYSSITDDYKRKTVAAVKQFFKFLLDDMNDSFNFNKNFGVTNESIRIVQEQVDKTTDLLTYLEKGITLHNEDIESQSDKIEETFFFYPIKGILQATSDKIWEFIKNKN